MEKYLRSNEEVSEEQICPDTFLQNHRGVKRRIAAVKKVLRRIPEQDWTELKKQTNLFHWFIPPTIQLGLVGRFPITHTEEFVAKSPLVPRAQILFLSPWLERPEIENDVVIYVAAHEIAHIILKHTTIGDRIEKEHVEANDLTKSWGFEKEMQAHKRYYRKLGILKETL